MSLLSRKNKHSNRDFEAFSLPQTRKAQFFDILKIHFPRLLLFGILMFLFMLPIIAMTDVRDFFLTNAILIFKEEELSNAKNVINYFSAALSIVAYIIFSIGLSALFKLYRRLVWSEPIFFKEDFTLGIKDNAGQFILTFFIVGLANLTVTFVSTILGDTHIVLILLYGFNLIFLFPVLSSILFLNAFYQNSFIANLILALKLFIRNFLFIILFCLTFYLEILLFLVVKTYLPILILRYVICLVIVIPLFSLTILFGFEIFIYIFDKQINSSACKDHFRKGLYVFKAKKKKV